MSRYYSVVVITVVVINGLHCIEHCWETHLVTKLLEHFDRECQAHPTY